MITIHIKETHPMAKALIDYLSKLSFVSVEKKEKIPNNETLAAIKEAKSGKKLTRVRNKKELKTFLETL